jgi:hypothetical protein
MDRFNNYSGVAYDAQIIVYYCFSYKGYKLTGRTTKARDLTQYLVNNGTAIYVPDFIIDEIKHKSIPKIVNDYIEDRRKPILEWPPHPSHGLVLRLTDKVKANFENLQKKNYFNVVEYSPDEITFNTIKSFFMNFNDKDKLNEFLNLKNTNILSPSDEDIMLILFAKDKQIPLISNDWDITFFFEELADKNLAHEIVNFKDISYPN